MEGSHPNSGQAHWQDFVSSLVPTPTRPPPQPTSTAAIAAAQAAAAAAASARPPTAPRNVNGSSSAGASAANSTGASEDEAYRSAQMKRRKEYLDAHVEKKRETWIHPVNGMEETMVFHRARALIDITTLSQTFICRATGIQNASLSQYLRGIFKGRQDLIEDKLEVFLNDYLEGKYDGQARKGVQGKRRSSSATDAAQYAAAPNGRRLPAPDQAMMANYQQRVAHQNALLAQQRQAALLRQQREFQHTRHQYGQAAAAAASNLYGQHAVTHAQQQQQQQLFAQRVAAAAQAAGRQYTPQQQQYLQQREYIIRQQQMQQYQMQLAARQQAQNQRRAAPVPKPKPTAPPLKPLPPTVAVERAFHAYHSSNLDIVCTNSEPLLLPIEIDVELAEDEDVGMIQEPVEVVQIDKDAPENVGVQKSGNSNDANDVQDMEVDKPVEEVLNKEKSQDVENETNQVSYPTVVKEKNDAKKISEPAVGSEHPNSEEKNILAIAESELGVATTNNSPIAFATVLMNEIIGIASSSGQHSEAAELEEQVKKSDVLEKSVNEPDTASAPGTNDQEDVNNIEGNRKEDGAAQADVENKLNAATHETEAALQSAALESSNSSASEILEDPENTKSDGAMNASSEIMNSDGTKHPGEKKVVDSDTAQNARNPGNEASSSEKQDEVMTDMIGDSYKNEKGSKSVQNENEEKEGDTVMKALDNDVRKQHADNPGESADEPKPPQHRMLQFYTQWDVNERRLSPEEVAESLVKTRNCVPGLIPKIAAQIRRQLFDVGVSCPVPPTERDKENRRRISIRVQLREDSDEFIEDTFDWDICMGEYNSPELFAQHLCSDNGVSQYHVPQVAQAIRLKIVLAQAIAYGDESTREAAFALLEPNDPLREKLPACKTGVKRLTPEEIRALHEKHVTGFVVQPLMRGVDQEIDRREEVRMVEEEERRRKEKKRLEEEEVRKREAREEEERKKRKYLTGLDTMNAKLGVQLDQYLGLKLGRGTSPSVWVEGIFIRKKRGLALLPAACGSEKTEEESQPTPTTRGRGRGRRGRRSAAVDGEERRTSAKKRSKRGRDSTAGSSTTPAKRRTSARNGANKRARK